MKPLLIALTLSFLVWPGIVSAEISKLVFTTDPQTVKPSILSAALTIQTQTADGVKEETSETIDLTFSSDSSSGEFLNPSGSVVAKTMSKGSANKNFYYRDPSLGTHQLSVTATLRDSRKAFSVGQVIIISADAPNGDNNSTSTSENSTHTTGEQTISGGVSGNTLYSAHSAQSDLGSMVIHPPEVGAGRARLGVAGADLVFEAWRKNQIAGTFSWSFGDGVKTEGDKVIHRYEFPGEYQVVLNAYFPEGQTVSRTKVLVVKPDLTISNVDWAAGFIELANSGAYEINLGGWVLQDQINRFIFPLDTIIEPRSKIKFSTSLLKLSGVGGLILAAPTGRVASNFSLDKTHQILVGQTGTSTKRSLLDPLVLAQRQRLV
ncbi:MAG: lamin tail domain-containing protein, partial [Patescibacteria group bacterium]